MKKYLAMLETPCIGCTPLSFFADSDKEADEIAAKTSLKDCFVPGGYDLYRIEYDGYKHKHVLVKIDPCDLYGEG